MRFRERTSKAWLLFAVATLAACASEQPLPQSHGGNEPQPPATPVLAPTPPEVAKITTPVPNTLSPDVAARLKSSLGQRLTHSIDGLTRRPLPGVGDTVRADGRFQHVVIQTRGANGQMHTECFENEAQLERSLGGGVAR